jgi:2,4-dienoyl-CoA reductase-like NADH-dependent reductase (Old Yellow Enzyme family)/thioredoxin reductase
MVNDFSILFMPLEIGKGRKRLKLKNRFVMPPMVTCTANTIGEVTQKTVDYYVERAKGGVGTIIVEAMEIDDKMLFNRLGIFHDRFINGLNYLASSIKEHGAKVFGQINESGIRAHLSGPDDLTIAEIGKLIEAYGMAADRLKRAEFDGVEIHGAHGYLISQFLSPVTNHRTDKYGGGREQRTKFAQEVIKSVREVIGEDVPIIFRMNGDDYLEGGIKIDDAKVIAKMAESAGADLIHVSAGMGASAHEISLIDNRSYIYLVPPMSFPRGCYVHMAADIKKVVKIHVITVGRITDPILAKEILTQGKADLVAIGRVLITDPYFPKKVAEGRIDEIRQCIACNYCHGKRIRLIKQLRCAVNPWAGREAELKNIKKVEVPKNIMIVGGGPAGMEAARWLKRRGHRPIIYEKNDRLGGQLLLASLPPHKEGINSFREFLIRQVEKLGIEVNLMTAVTQEFVLKKKPDVLVVATGGRPIKPNLPIDKKMKCLNALDVISGKEEIPGEKIVLLGGSYMAAEIAEFIAERGKGVTIIARRDLIAFDMEALTRQLLMERLEKLKVKMITNTQVQEVTAKGVKGIGVKDGSIKEFPADIVVIAFGSEPVEFSVEDIKKAGIEVHFIGDAKEINGIPEATRDGFVVGTSL